MADNAINATVQAAYDLAKAEGRDYQPQPSEDSFDPHPHYFLNALALHFDDKSAIASQAFTIQHHPAPSRADLG